MSQHPDTPAADFTLPQSAGDHEPTILDDTLSEDEAIPLSVAKGGEAPREQNAVSEDQVKLALRRVKDPDLNLNILDLGLVYDIKVEGATVDVDMTLTSPGCPSGPEIMGNAQREIGTLPGVKKVNMNLVWVPFWTPERVEPRVRAYLGF